MERAKVDEDGLLLLERRELGLPHSQAVQEERVALIRHLDAQHAGRLAVELRGGRAVRRCQWGGVCTRGIQILLTLAPSSTRTVSSHARLSRSATCTRKGTTPSNSGLSRFSSSIVTAGVVALRAAGARLRLRVRELWDAPEIFQARRVGVAKALASPVCHERAQADLVSY